MVKNKQFIVIGAGISGMAAAAVLAQAGAKVKVLEKNPTTGGRCRSWSAEGFTFDMGPSWYWMPDVFERFYARFNHKAADFYRLKRLDPSYSVFFKDGEFQLPADYTELKNIFEQTEKGAGKKLDEFLESAAYKYEVGMRDFVYKPSLSWLEFADLKVLKGALKLQLLGSLSKEVRTKFTNPKLVSILEFPVLFLGAKPQHTPAMYSLMNYGDIKLGTWYPEGGMVKIAEAFEAVAREQGVEFELNTEVKEFEFDGNKIKKVIAHGKVYETDAVINAADYHHVDQKVLPEKFRNYTPSYWGKRKMSPSSLLFYLGLKEQVPNLQHHNLFFDADFDAHAKEIYDHPQWPKEPLFYACCPSKTDSSVAPAGKENLFLLMPLAPGIEEREDLHNYYLELMAERIEKQIGLNILPLIEVKRVFSVNDFESEYNSFKGNAYGLANTLLQTAVLKPSIKSKKLKNLYHCGQLTVPGPGLPPTIISGQVAADLAIKQNSGG